MRVTYGVLVTELCPGLAVNSVDPSCPCETVTTDRDIQEVVSRGLAHSNWVFAITLSALGGRPLWPLWQSCGPLAPWLWGDKLRCLFALCSLLPQALGGGNAGFLC